MSSGLRLIWSRLRVVNDCIHSKTNLRWTSQALAFYALGLHSYSTGYCNYARRQQSTTLEALTSALIKLLKHVKRNAPERLDVLNFVLALLYKRPKLVENIRSFMPLKLIFQICQEDPLEALTLARGMSTYSAVVQNVLVSTDRSTCLIRDIQTSSLSYWQPNFAAPCSLWAISDAEDFIGNTETDCFGGSAP